jgi:hypothetical protein
MDNHYRRATDRLRDMYYFIPEAAEKAEEMNKVVQVLVEQDKM